VDEPRAGAQGGARGERRRTRHSDGAADHHDAAEVSLVRAAFPRGKERRDVRRREEVEFRRDFSDEILGKTEVEDMEFAHVVGGVLLDYPELRQSECERVPCARRQVERSSRVGVQSGGKIEGNHCVRGIAEDVHQCTERVFHRAIESGSPKAVEHDERMLSVARLADPFDEGVGFGGSPRPKEAHATAEFRKMTARDERVRAVVPLSCENKETD